MSIYDDDDFSDSSIFDRPAAVQRPAERADADPAEEPVRVVLAADGSVTDVLVAPDWRETVGPRRLGAALLEAAQVAVGKTIEAQLAGLDLDAAAAPAAAAPAPATVGDPASRDAEAFMADALALLRNFATDLESYLGDLTRMAGAVSTGSGGARGVTVTMAGGVVTAVDVDAEWAAGARHTEVSVEALAAFRAAAARAVDAAREVALPTSLARIQELGSDPVELSRRLGLTR